MFSQKLLNSSSLIRVYLLHPCPSLFLYGLSLSLRFFSILVDFYFQVYFNLKVMLCKAKITKNNSTEPLLFYFTKLSLQCVFSNPVCLRPFDGKQATVFRSRRILEVFQTLGPTCECSRTTGKELKKTTQPGTSCSKGGRCYVPDESLTSG